jgi:hypothetical protein
MDDNIDTGYANDQVGVLIAGQTVVIAFGDLPTLAKLKFVKNVLLGNGGDKRSIPAKPELIVAVEVLDLAIEDFETRSSYLNLPSLQPT